MSGCYRLTQRSQQAQGDEREREGVREREREGVETKMVDFSRRERDREDLLWRTAVKYELMMSFAKCIANITQSYTVQTEE